MEVGEQSPQHSRPSGLCGAIGISAESVRLIELVRVNNLVRGDREIREFPGPPLTASRGEHHTRHDTP